ncbi:hypothetical protein K5E_26780 [Enterococcus thailandicus]|uniref:hypothetical protein n=1 Tax=Enterococcus TaxID=1350 RepID=UPI00094C2C57|nr:hypothetical protein [Enterococcus thailandicus]MDA3964886.1 hypothetical protein [Enterococcus thailandicus]MDT2752037.1 hypothetical protein [Enterococcus thailandicus]MDT2777085.1 hypothetical protein [Enterococcus thailandicus]GMC04337.1 hypothetical protein K4E_18810 [Enterococcus thailandicus]GMC10538.1 hypothetical protein K5E_26780 [Enterococcus thailandicus]
MNTANLDSFLKSGFITILAFGVIVLILKHWKGAEWLKIGSVILIALILNDFAMNQGKNIFTLVKWVLNLFGISM